MITLRSCTSMSTSKTSQKIKKAAPRSTSIRFGVGYKFETEKGLHEIICPEKDLTRLMIIISL